MVIRAWLPLVLAAMVVSGCAGTRSIGRSTDEFRIEPGIANVAVSTAEYGVFFDSESGKVRARLRNKPLISVIDEFAYKAGFNYAMLSDLSTYRVTLDDQAGKQVVRDNERAMLDTLLEEVNRNLPAGEPKVGYRWVSDGPMFSKCAALPCDTGAEPGLGFKKMFFKNISADEALVALTELFESEVEMKRDVEFKESRLSLDRISKDTKGDDKKAAIVAYRAQNALLVRGNTAVFDRLAQVLPSLDAEFQLVLVETQVFEYDDSIARKIGTALEYSKGTLNNNPAKPEFALKTLFGENTSITDALPQLFWNLSDIERKASLLTNLAFYDRDGLVRIMAEPRLTLKSGEQAEVKLTTKRFYMTTSVNAAGDIKDLETGITFNVQPTLLGDGKILLKLKLQQSEFIPSNDTNAISATNANLIDTSVIARDGELVSLGGILTKREAKMGSGLPGLRNLPGLGVFFGYEASDSNVTRVEFMIRPTVKRAPHRNEAILKGLSDTNCRITRYMNKTTYDCEDPVAGGEVKDLDAPATAQ